MSLAASCAIFDDDKIVLIKREDFEVWALPSGKVESGESAGAAALREALEETGLAVSANHLIGLYSIPRWQDGALHTALFSAAIVGGVLRGDPDEVIDIGFFPRDALPEPLLWWHRQRISDAFEGGKGLARTQDVPWPFDPTLTRRELYELRDQSGLSRPDFYRQTFERGRE